MTPLTPNGEWEVYGGPWNGVPIVRLQRVGQLMTGYAWWVDATDYSGPVGFVYQYPMHQYANAENNLLGSVGRQMSDRQEYMDQIGPFIKLEVYARTPQPTYANGNHKPRRKRK